MLQLGAEPLRTEVTFERKAELVSNALPASHMPHHEGAALPADHFPARALANTPHKELAAQQAQPLPHPGQALPSRSMPHEESPKEQGHAPGVSTAHTQDGASQAVDFDNQAVEGSTPMLTPGSSLPREQPDLAQDGGHKQEHMDDIEFDLEKEKEGRETVNEANRVKESIRIAQASAEEQNSDIGKAKMNAKIQAEHDMVEKLLSSENESQNMKDYVHLLEQMSMPPWAAFEKAKGRRDELERLPSGVYSKRLEQAIA